MNCCWFSKNWMEVFVEVVVEFVAVVAVVVVSPHIGNSFALPHMPSRPRMPRMFRSVFAHN